MSRNKTDKNHTMRGRCCCRSRADEVATPQPTWGLGLTGIAHAPREKKKKKKKETDESDTENGISEDINKRDKYNTNTKENSQRSN